MSGQPKQIVAGTPEFYREFNIDPPANAFEALTDAIGAPMRQAAEQPKRSKYNNKKTEVDGITFDSALEARHWAALRLLEQSGHITDLQRQVAFPCVIERSYRNRTVRTVETYVADFVYWEGGKMVVADAKGHTTKEYEAKRRWMKELYQVEILELK